MSLGTTLQVIALCSVLVGGGWLAKDYQLEHKPMSQAMWAWIEFDKCRDSVKEAQLKVCLDLQIPEEQCPINLEQCDKYKQAK